MKGNRDIISVIVPVYNAESYLHRCVDSILEQTYSDIELIMVDDASTDSSGEICDEYALKDTRVKVIRCKENGGTSAARNIGLEAISGQFVGFVDCDDFIEPDFYEILYGLITKYGTDVSMISYNKVDEHGRVSSNSSEQVYVLDRIEAIKELLFDKKIQNYVWNKLYRAKIFQKIRFPAGVIYDDINIMYYIFRKMNMIACYDIAKYNYCFRENSIVNRRSHKKFEDELSAVELRYKEIAEDFPELEEYNAYAFVLWMVRIYTFMVSTDDYMEEFYRERYELLINVYKKNYEFIISRLKYKKSAILFLILWNFDKCRNVIKKLCDEESGKSERSSNE